jgi:hypothetical protein
MHVRTLAGQLPYFQQAPRVVGDEQWGVDMHAHQKGGPSFPCSMLRGAGGWRGIARPQQAGGEEKGRTRAPKRGTIIPFSGPQEEG